MGATVRVFVMPKHRIDELTLSNTDYQWFIDYCYDYSNADIEDKHLPVYGHCENALTSWLSDSQPGKRALSLGTPIWILHASEINEHIDLLRSALNEDMEELIVRGFSDEVYDRSWSHMDMLAFMLQIRAMIEKCPDYYIVIDAQW
jgi:hypothetical protein